MLGSCSVPWERFRVTWQILKREFEIDSEEHWCSKNVNLTVTPGQECDVLKVPRGGGIWRHILKYGLDWICKTRTGFVKRGFVKHGFVKHGFVKHGFVKHGFVKHGFVKHGFVATNSNTENYPCLISFLRPSALFFTCLLDAEYSLFHVIELTEKARSRYVQLL